MNKKVLCRFCKKPIHIDKFGGADSKGMFCNNTFCLCKLVQEDVLNSGSDKK